MGEKILAEFAELFDVPPPKITARATQLQDGGFGSSVAPVTREALWI